MAFRSDCNWLSVGWAADDNGMWHRFGVDGDYEYARGTIYRLQCQCDGRKGRWRDVRPHVERDPPDGVPVCAACVEARRRQVHGE